MKKKILCLMMAAILAVGAPLTAFARDYQGADGCRLHLMAAS